jgi:hypothetical protein
MKTNDHNNFQKVRLTDSDPLEKNQFADDFERDAFEGFSKHPGWKRDIPEMKHAFRKKWGINRFPLYFRMSVYTFATAVCLVFVFIISEKWFDPNFSYGDKYVADNKTLDIPTSKQEITGEKENEFVEKNKEVNTRNEIQTIAIVKDAETDIKSGDVLSSTDITVLEEDNTKNHKGYFELDDQTTKKDAFVASNDSDEAGASFTSREVEKAKADKKTTTLPVTGVAKTLGGEEMIAGLADLPSIDNRRKTYPTEIMYDMKVVDYSGIYTFKPEEESTVDAISVSSRFADRQAKAEAQKEVEVLKSPDYVPYKDFLYEAMKKFAAKSYAAALADYQTILKQYPADMNALFYGGMCNYYLKANDQAISNFDKIIKDNADIFYEEAEWYKALTLIQSSKMDEAKKLLNKIANSQHYYQKEAAAKLSEIK